MGELGQSLTRWRSFGRIKAELCLLCLVSGLLGLLLKQLFLRSTHGNQLDRQFIDLAGETERRLLVSVAPAGAAIHSDIEGLINRLDKWNGVRNRFTRNRLTVHRKHAGAALAETGAVVFKVKHDGVLAGSERRRA